MTEHAPEQLDAETLIEKLTPEFIANVVRQDVTTPEFLRQRWDLEDCTFIIPLRIESEDRLRNIVVSLIYLLRNFNTKVIVKEVDKTSEFQKCAMPMLEAALEDFHMEGLTHIFEQSEEQTFHRTKIINDMLWMVDTPVTCNYDCDILLPKTSYPYSVNMIMHGWKDPKSESDELYYPKVVYPYGRGMYQAQINTNDEEVTKFINEYFDFEIFSPFSSKNNSYANPEGFVFPISLIIFVESIALSIRSFPYISKSTSSAYHLIAQSTFHCNLQFPSRTLVSKSFPLLSKIIIDFFSFISFTGISNTWPVSGHMGKKGL